jgi:UDP-glucose 4-epimerase
MLKLHILKEDIRKEGLKIKILVTGAAGFIGSHIVDKYVELGHEIVVIDNLSSGNKQNINPKVKFYETDITDLEKIRKIILDEKPDIINHHAAQISVTKSIQEPELDFKVNVEAFENIINTAKQANTKKIIFPSSAAVYGDTKELPTKEDTKKEPMSPYAENKLKAEQLLINSNINFTILRYSNVYGPRQSVEGEAGVVAIFCNKLLKQQTPTIFGDGKQLRDFIFVKDIAEANILVLDNGDNKIMNISTGKGNTINELFNILKEISEFENEPNYENPRKGDILKSYLDNTKAKEILDWKPETDFKQGLKKTFEWFKQSK